MKSDIIIKYHNAGFKLIGVGPWYIDGYELEKLKMTNRHLYYVSDPNGRGFQVKKKDILFTAYCWFFEPTEKDLRRHINKFSATRLREALLENDERLRELFLNAYWRRRAANSKITYKE